VLGMEAGQDNQCAACTIGQDCCTHLAGLRLTEPEFNRCFKQHADEIAVMREGPLFIVSQINETACPNWREGKCSVYDARPRECALFPYTLYTREHRDDSVSVRVHSDTRCPFKLQLLSSRQEAEQLAHVFAEEAFGDTIKIHVGHETMAQRLYRRFRNFISRILSALL